MWKDTPAMCPPLGAHVSIAGGMSRAIDRGTELGCNAIQVFVKNASQWQGKPLNDDDVKQFRQAHADSPIGPLVAHATYLVNLSATDPDNLRRSRATFGDEIDRCERLGIPALVVHPGAHLGAGMEAGLELVGESLREILAARPEGKTRILLEITAGQGTLVGSKLEELATIRTLTGLAHRIGLCFDTCHAFAAGYPLHQQQGYRAFLVEMAELFGPEEPSCIHLNDSRHELGARRDRHANLGQGQIPLELFGWLIHEPALSTVPMILETPLGDDGDGHRRDLELLRSL